MFLFSCLCVFVFVLFIFIYVLYIFSVYYLLFVSTNAHTHTCIYIYIKVPNYITNAATCFVASAQSSGSFDIALLKLQNVGKITQSSISLCMIQSVLLVPINSIQ